MRIYTNPLEAMLETERDLYEMGITVHPQTMQDKNVADDPDYETKEVRGYGFKIVDWELDLPHIKKVISHFFPEQCDDVLTYILQEFRDRVGDKPSNPGISWIHRQKLWSEFIYGGKFAYTYSERINPQLKIITNELRGNPETRQGIINIHSNISPDVEKTIEDTSRSLNFVCMSADLHYIGGGGRIPCSMYYQIMIREEKIDLIYTMRSCDLLVHFPIDISLALLLQDWFVHELKYKVGTFTYFTGSLHAYQKDLKERGIF